MTDLAYLDTLSNSDLRSKCIEYNLPNVPITNSSRSIMVRKLRSVMLGEPELGKKAKKSQRRETVHNTNIGNKATTRTGKSPQRLNTSIQNNNLRRTIGSDAESVRSRKSETTTTLSSSDIGSQSEEEENYNYSTPSREDSHLRRSVSLTKSGVLTTSYTQESTPLRSYIETDELDNDMANLSNTNLDRSKYGVFSSPQNVNSYTQPNYKPSFEHKVQPSLYTRPTLTQTQLNTNNYTGVAGFSIADNANEHRNTFAGSTAPFSYGANRQRTTPFTSVQQISKPKSKPKRTTTTAITGGSSLYPKLQDFYDEDAADSVDSSASENDADVVELETPYLSKFTRTLETAKRNTLSGGVPVARRNISSVQNNDVKEQFAQFIMALERKYHLKQAFAILAVVVLAIFIYVLISPV